MVFIFRKSLLATLFLMFVIVSVNPAGAQEKEEAENKGSQPVTLDATVVTAQKREENVQDVPISMDVFSGMQIEDAGIRDLSELTLFSPNVYAKQSTNQQMIIMRGLSSHNVVLNTPAGLFVDDICYPLTFMQNPELFDIERVEVLRGPQGTLYGHNTESGAIRIITRQPDNTFKGKVFVEPGFYNSSERNSWLYTAGASLSGPLVEDTLYVGGAFLTKGTPGYMENVYDGDKRAAKEESQNGQIKLRWTPSDPWDISLLVNASRKDNGYGYMHYIEGPLASDKYTINWDGANSWVDESNGQSLHLKYKANWADVTSITTRNDYNTTFKNDGEFGPLIFPDQEFRFTNESYSQEFRLSSIEDGNPFEWLGGVFVSHDNNEAKAAFFGQLRNTTFENTSYAAFGQLAYTFFDKLKLSAGLRWDHHQSDGEQDLVSAGQSYDKSSVHDDVLPKVSISYDVTDHFMTYASFSKGLLAGGYNYAFATDEDTLVFGPETTWNYELGMKSDWFDKKFKFNATGYYIAIKDKQVEEFLGGPAVRSVTNAAKASSRGFEVEMEYRPAQGWFFFGNGGYADARIDEWVSDEMGGGTYDYKDKKLPHAPEYTYNLGTEYVHETGYFGRLDLLGVGGFYTDAKNTTWVSPYEVVNVRAGRRMESWDVSVWCKNLLNREYYQDKGTYIGGNEIASDGAPRSVGVNLTYRF